VTNTGWIQELERLKLEITTIKTTFAAGHTKDAVGVEANIGLVKIVVPTTSSPIQLVIPQINGEREIRTGE
jgi:hypothetical protein